MLASHTTISSSNVVKDIDSLNELYLLIGLIFRDNTSYPDTITKLIHTIDSDMW